MKILLMALTLGIVASAQIVNNGTGTGGSGGGTPPYVVPSFTGSPQTVTAATMLAAGKPQGPDAQAICWFSSSPSVGVSCTTSNSNPAGAGDVTFAYGETPFRVVIATPGSGSQGATGAAGTPGLGCGTLGGVLGGTCAAATLNNTAVTPGSYTNTNLTVGADGRITAATNGSGGAGNGPNLPNYTQTGGGTGAIIGGNLSTSAPYNIINNGLPVVSLTAQCTLVVSSGTAGDTIYVSGNPEVGALQFAYNSANTYTISGANCTLVSSATGYTGEQILYTITVTAGVLPASVNPGYGSQTGIVAPGTGIGVVRNAITGDRTVSVLPQQALAGFTSTGTKFTITGCSAGTTVGGASAGTFVSGTTGTCTVVITINGATGFTATNGWSCQVSDLTTGNLMRQTATSVTTCTVSGTTVSGDVISFIAVGY